MTRINSLQGLFTLFFNFFYCADDVQFPTQALIHTFHNFLYPAHSGGVKYKEKAKYLYITSRYIPHFTHLHLPVVLYLIRPAGVDVVAVPVSFPLVHLRQSFCSGCRHLARWCCSCLLSCWTVELYWLYDLLRRCELCPPNGQFSFFSLH